MNHAATMQNPAAVAYESEYQRKWVKSEQRDHLEDHYRRTMQDEMRDGSFLNEYADDDEIKESLSRILAASYGDIQMLRAAVIVEREQLINKHAPRVALRESED